MPGWYHPWTVRPRSRPNAGFTRSLVSSIAGTTRDVVSTRIALEGWPVELVDTAGFHESASALEKEGMLRNYEETLRRKDGSVMYSMQNCFAVRDAAGKVTQYRGLILDITEQKKFQAQLQRERKVVDHD